ncbi:MAG: epsilon-lactone hydrolase [Acidimicrobiaceae bacterium]|jgi:acetyl esterase/lipase
MASEQLEQVKELLGAIDLLDGTLEERRALMDSFGQEAPDGTSVTTVDAGGVPAEWIVAPAADADRVILYLHGGGYSLGSLDSHRRLVAHLSIEAKARVLNVDYRLAPEHPYPAAVDDAVAAYRWLLGQGVRAGRIAISGDSAGGGLTLATLLALKDAGDPLPAAAVPLSPWTDLEGTGDSMRTRAAADLMIQPARLKETADLYANGADLRQPQLSPLHGDYAGLPPLLIQVGDAEVLLDDATRVAAIAEAAGVSVTLEVWDEMPHVFQAFVGLLPESDRAVARIGAWLQARIP